MNNLATLRGLAVLADVGKQIDITSMQAVRQALSGKAAEKSHWYLLVVRFSPFGINYGTRLSFPTPMRDIG